MYLHYSIFTYTYYTHNVTGALQSLLSTLQRASDWPEVEKQISKVVSVLVTYEDDWALLQRNALLILTTLYTLQIKTITQCRSTKVAVDNVNEELGNTIVRTNSVNGELGNRDMGNRSRTASCSTQVTVLPNTQENTPVYTTPATTADSSSSSAMNIQRFSINNKTTTESLLFNNNNTTNNNKNKRNNIDTNEIEQLLFQSDEKNNLLKIKEKTEYLAKLQEQAEDEQESLKALIAAAVGKLSLVLASEWGKLTTPLGNFHTASSNNNVIGITGMNNHISKSFLSFFFIIIIIYLCFCYKYIYIYIYYYVYKYHSKLVVIIVIYCTIYRWDVE